jgi:hypothetical protein
MTTDQQGPAIGAAVVYTDPKGQDHEAIVTNAYGTSIQGAINVAFVSADTSRTDTFGRQIERETSVLHQTIQPTHGRFWRHVGEDKKTVSEPSLAHAQ